MGLHLNASPKTYHTPGRKVLEAMAADPRISATDIVVASSISGLGLLLFIVGSFFRERH